MDPRYPIGRFTPDATPTPEARTRDIAEIAALPQRFRNAVSGLSDTQLSTPYREGGWTVRQLIHHVPDSHLNAYIRCKLALTEDSPTIKPYDQEAWANLADSALTSAEVSLSLLEAVHTRWVNLLRSLKPPRVYIYTSYQFNITTLLYDTGPPILAPATHPYLHETNRHYALLLLS